jgi:hypothetical protein
MYVPGAILAVRIFIPLLFFTGFFYTSSAQILNVEKSRIKEDSANYFIGNIGFSFSLYNRDAGEDDPNNFIGITGNGNFAYMAEKHSYILINYINYTAIQSNPLVQTGYVHLRTNFFREARISNEVFAQYQYDLGRGLKSRWLGGTGVRINLIESENTELVFGPGIMYEYEKWESPIEGEPDREAKLFKSTNYISIRQDLNDNIEFNAISYYQTGYDSSIDNFRHRISGDLNLNIEITNKLSLTTSFTCTFENRPIVPVTKFIYTITNGLAFSF